MCIKSLKIQLLKYCINIIYLELNGINIHRQAPVLKTPDLLKNVVTCMYTCI